MELEILKQLLDIHKRQLLFDEILECLKELNELEDLKCETYTISEGIIPVVTISKSLDISKIKYLKLFVAAQHNEYNGLFGIINFLKLIKDKKIKIDDILIKNQVLIFLPLMNPYGFLNPSKNNKSGYYLKNGTNLNRF